jgi:hypothetical protein
MGKTEGWNLIEEYLESSTMISQAGPGAWKAI